MSETEKVSAFVRPSFPYRPGEGPTHVEYEWQLLSGEVRTASAPIDQAVEVDSPARIRYRFLWNGRPSAWNDQGSTIRALN